VGGQTHGLTVTLITKHRCRSWASHCGLVRVFERLNGGLRRADMVREQRKDDQRSVVSDPTRGHSSSPKTRDGSLNLSTCEHWSSTKTWHLRNFGPGLSVLPLSDVYAILWLVQACTSPEKFFVGSLMDSDCYLESSDLPRRDYSCSCLRAALGLPQETI
jgi:hypothetical protein